MGGNNYSKDHWQPDNEFSSCRTCEEPFTFLRRRHHCRCCGSIFCHECTSNKGQIPSQGIMKPVRLCDLCFAKQSGGSGGGENSCWHKPIYPTTINGIGRRFVLGDPKEKPPTPSSCGNAPPCHSTPSTPSVDNSDLLVDYFVQCHRWSVHNRDGPGGGGVHSTKENRLLNIDAPRPHQLLPTLSSEVEFWIKRFEADQSSSDDDDAEEENEGTAVKGPRKKSKFLKAELADVTALVYAFLPLRSIGALRSSCRVMCRRFDLAVERHLMNSSSHDSNSKEEENDKESSPSFSPRMASTIATSNAIPGYWYPVSGMLLEKKYGITYNVATGSLDGLPRLVSVNADQSFGFYYDRSQTRYTHNYTKKCRIVATPNFFLNELFYLTHLDFSADSDVEVIGNYFMRNCRSLIKVDFSGLKKLRTIGENFLQSSSALEFIDFSCCTSLEEIGNSFLCQSCALKKVTMGTMPALKSINYRFLSLCVNLEYVLFSTSTPARITSCTRAGALPAQCNLKSLGEDLFYGCKSLKLVDFSGFVNVSRVELKQLNRLSSSVLKLPNESPESLKKLLLGYEKPKR